VCVVEAPGRKPRHFRPLSSSVIAFPDIGNQSSRVAIIEETAVDAVAIPLTEPAASPDALLERARGDDLAAFEALYRLTRHEVARGLAHLVDRAQLHRAIGEAYLALLAETARPSSAPFRPLIQRLLVQLALKKGRFRRSAVAGSLHRRLVVLGAKQRLVFVLNHVLALTPEDIAVTAGLPLDGVRRLLEQARLRLTAACRKAEGGALTPHDVSTLWALSTGEVTGSDAALATRHLQDCPDCREDLALIRALQSDAARAADAVPELQWSGIDRIVGAALEKRALRGAGLQTRWRWVLVPTAALVAAVCLGGWMALSTHAEARPAPAQGVEPLAGPRLLHAREVTRVSDKVPMSEGSSLTVGESIRTARSGHAVLSLPAAVELRLGGDTQLRLEALEEVVGLALEGGRVVVRAARPVHVSSAGFAVQGTGTFLVGTVRGGVEVAVARGRVHVERPNALPAFVDGGHRVVFAGNTTRTVRSGLTPENQAELGVGLMASTTSVPARLPLPAKAKSVERRPAPIAQRPVAPARQVAVPTSAPPADSADTAAPAAEAVPPSSDSAAPLASERAFSPALSRLEHDSEPPNASQVTQPAPAAPVHEPTVEAPTALPEMLQAEEEPTPTPVESQPAPSEVAASEPVESPAFAYPEPPPTVPAASVGSEAQQELASGSGYPAPPPPGSGLTASDEPALLTSGPTATDEEAASAEAP